MNCDVYLYSFNQSITKCITMLLCSSSSLEQLEEFFFQRDQKTLNLVLKNSTDTIDAKN